MYPEVRLAQIQDLLGLVHHDPILVSSKRCDRNTWKSIFGRDLSERAHFVGAEKSSICFFHCAWGFDCIVFAYADKASSLLFKSETQLKHASVVSVRSVVSLISVLSLTADGLNVSQCFCVCTAVLAAMSWDLQIHFQLLLSPVPARSDDDHFSSFFPIDVSSSFPLSSILRKSSFSSSSPLHVVTGFRT